MNVLASTTAIALALLIAAPASAAYEHSRPKNRIGAINSAGADCARARVAAARETHWGKSKALAETAAGNTSYQNHYRWYSPDLGRDLSSEPLLRNPRYITVKARRGMSPHAYAYAANSPLEFIDPTGLIFTGTTPELDATLRALETSYGSWLGTMVRELRTSPNVVVDFSEVANPSQWLKDLGGAATRTQRNTCTAADPTRAWISFNRDYAASALFKKFGLSLTFDQLIAHELGHVWDAYSSARFLAAQGLGDDELVFKLAESVALDSRTSLQWENATRWPGPYRPRH